MTEPRVETLSNGLDICVAPQPHLHTVAVGMFIRDGSRFETENENGISHLIEHMVFRGTPKYPTVKDFMRAVELLGGEINAWTTYDTVCYHIEAPTESGQGILDLLLELFEGPRLEGFEREREVVLEEVRADMGAAGQDLDIDDIARGTAFRGSSLGRKVTGTEETVSALTVEHLRSHLREFYTADNMALVITGNTSQVTIPTSSNIPRGHMYKARLTAAPNWQKSSVRFVRNRDSAQTQVAVSVRTPGSFFSDYHALYVLHQVLNGGMSARVEQQIREKGLAYEAGVELDLQDECGLLTLYGNASRDKLLPLAEGLFGLLRGLSTIADDEFSLAKKQVEWAMNSTRDSAMGYMAQLGHLVLRHCPPDLDVKRDMLRHTTKDEAESMARELLDNQKVYVTCVGPVSAEDKKAIKSMVSVYSKGR